MAGPYEELMKLGRPKSHRAAMSNGERAKIFSPFAALRGYDEAVQSQNLLRVNQTQLSEESMARLNTALCALQKGDEAVATYFRPDYGPNGMGGKAEGFYESARGVVERLEPLEQYLRLRVGAEQVLDIPFSLLQSLEPVRPEEELRD